MKNVILLPLVCAVAIQSAAAADNQPATLMTERGKLLLSEDFAKSVKPATRPQKGKTWGDGWRMQVGKWEFADGCVTGAEQAADKHGAVARYPLKFKDVVIQYDVKLDGCKMTTLSVNDEKEHVCRVLLSPAGFTAQKDDHDHTGPDKAEVFGKAAMPLKAGQWYTVVLEILGDEMVAHIKGKAVVGSNALIGTDKANFGFTVAGETASFKNVRVWEAKPNSAWAANKKKLSAAK